MGREGSKNVVTETASGTRSGPCTPSFKVGPWSLHFSNVEIKTSVANLSIKAVTSRRFGSTGVVSSKLSTNF